MPNITLTNNKIDKLPSGKFYGIDLGTSYTLVAEVDVASLNPDDIHIPVRLCTIKQNSPQQYDGADISEMVASIVAVGDDNKMYVGNKLYPLKADLHYVKDRNIFYHWKLDLGVSKKPLYEDAVRDDLDDASKVAGKILNYCRKSLKVDDEWANVVITVPASFQNAQRNDVIAAARYADIQTRDGMLFDEPTAAFLGYFNQMTTQERTEFLSGGVKKVLVVDFGGGTIDLSTIVVEREGTAIGIDNIAISRYNDLGGQDIDMILAEKYLLPQISQRCGLESADLETVQTILPQLAVMAEKMKKDLCRTLGALSDDYSKLDVSENITSELQDQKITLRNEVVDIQSITLNAKQLDTVTKFLFQADEYQLSFIDKVVRSIPTVVNDVVAKSHWRMSDINYVLLAGGSVQNPLFVKHLQELLLSTKVILPRRPDTLVAEGAAINSFYKFGLGIDLFHPICSDTIGVSTANAAFFPLINAGEHLPVKVSLPSFKLQSDFQTDIEIPCCLNSESNIVGILKGKAPSTATRHDTLEIEMAMDKNKTLKVSLLCGGNIVTEMTIDSPNDVCNLTEEERHIREVEEAIRRAKSTGNYRDERSALRSLIWEYYYLGNYKRSIQTAEAYLADFDSTDPYVLNILYCAYKELGQRKKAEEYLERALSYHPQNSTLVYNKSLIIERQEGKQAALDYLKANNPHGSTDINMRIALLSYDLGNDEPAKEIKQRHDVGGINPNDHFTSNLLKQILDKINISNNYEVVEDENRKQHVLSANNDALLEVKGDISRR